MAKTQNIYNFYKIIRKTITNNAQIEDKISNLYKNRNI